MKQEHKSRAFNPRYESTRQLEIDGFESPFTRTLNPHNRWVVFSKLIPWDDICSQCRHQLGNSGAGRKPLNPRIVTGSLIIKYMLNLDDSEQDFLHHFPNNNVLEVERKRQFQN